MKFYALLPKLGAKNFKPSEYKKEANGKKKNHFPCNPFRKNYIAFKILIPYIINQMHYNEHCQT
jgi:hypothetical protein